METDLKNIKLVVSEVDGVVTEHLSNIGEMGVVMSKQYCMKDFEAINLIKKNMTFVFISSDAAINMSLCRGKNIPFFYAGNNKKKIFSEILRRYDVTPDNVLYVGSTFSDIECMKLAGVSLCTEDAVTQVKNIADAVVPVYGGVGVLCYVYTIIKKEIIRRNKEC